METWDNNVNCSTILSSHIVLKEHASKRVDVDARSLVQMHCPTTESSNVYERAARFWFKLGEHSAVMTKFYIPFLSSTSRLGKGKIADL